MNCNFSISATTSNTIQLLIHGSSKNVQFRLGTGTGSNLTTHFKHHVQNQMHFVLILSISVLYASMMNAL